jgi:hypothetical protein
MQVNKMMEVMKGGALRFINSATSNIGKLQVLPVSLRISRSKPSRLLKQDVNLTTPNFNKPCPEVE